MRTMQSALAWVRAQPRWVPDALLAACLAAIQLWVLVAVPAGTQGYRGPDAPAVAVALLTALPVAARRVRPGAVVAVIGLAMVAAAGLAVPTTGFGLVVALYTSAAWGTRDAALLPLAVFAACTLAALVLADALRFAPVNLLVFAAAWVLGDRRRLERRRTEALERRAAALDREREVTARLASARERERIAHELHDVIAHGVTVMVTQAGAAERLLDVDAEAAGAALASTEETGRASLGELRRLVSLLRSAADPGPPRPAAR